MAVKRPRPPGQEVKTEKPAAGLQAGLEKEFGEKPKGTPEEPPTPAEPPNPSKVVPPAPTEEPPAKPPEEPPGKKPEEKPPVVKKIEMPTIGKPEAAPAAKPGDDFDEAAFDKETTEAFPEDQREGPAFEKWKDLRNQLKGYQKGESIPKSAEAKMAELQQAAEKTAELEKANEAMQAKLKDLSAVSAEARVAAGPRFEAQVTQPEKAVRTSIEQIAEHTGIDKGVLMSVVDNTDLASQTEAIEQMRGKLGSVMESRVVRACEDMTAIRSTKTHLLENAQEQLAEEQKEAEQAHKQRMDEFSQSVIDFGKHHYSQHAEDLGFIADGKETEIGRQIQGQILSADPMNFTSDNEGFMVFAGVALPFVAQELLDSQARVAELEAEINERDGGRPKPSTPSRTTSPGGSEKKNKKKGLLADMAGKSFSG